jgi:two-component sensor histidine kinase
MTSGRISVNWSVELAKGQFMMSWLERGGPPIIAGVRSGFGSSIISQATELALQATVTVRYAAAGLSWDLFCPVANVLEV